MRARQQFWQAMTIKNVIAENERDPFGANEIGADDERVGQAARLVLMAYENRRPKSEPSPSSRSNSGLSCGVLMMRISRMPANIRVASG